MPDTATNSDALMFFDMLAQSDELEIPKDELRQSIEAGNEPFMTLFHNGSTTESTEAFALQFAISVNSWTLSVGEKASNGNDFLTACNQVTVLFAQYGELTVTNIANGIFATLTGLLSGKLQILTSKYASGGVYGTELLIVSGASEQSVDTSWFGGKNVEQPATTALLKNSVLTKSQDITPEFLLTTDLNDKPIVRGRTFSAGNYTPLTYTDYKLYAPKQKTDPRKTLGILFTGIVALYIAITVTQNFFPNSVWPFVVLVILFVFLVGALARKFPYIALAGLAPMVGGFAVFGVFVGVGMLLYATIPQLADAVDGDNTALSMTLVLGWGIIGFITGSVAYVKLQNRLTKLAAEKTDILK